MQTCPNCGAQVAMGKKFCANCGTRMPQQPPQPHQSPQPQNIPQQFQQTQPPQPPPQPQFPPTANPSFQTPDSPAPSLPNAQFAPQPAQPPQPPSPAIPNSPFPIPNSPPPSFPNSQFAPQPAQPPPRKISTRNWVLIAMSAAALFIIVVLLVAFLGNNAQPPEINDDPAITIETPPPPPTPPIDEPPPPPPVVIEQNDETKESWAIYWYLCGTDLETRAGMASADLAEMLSVQLPDKVTVVIETGGTREWQRSDIDPNSNSRYVYDSQGFRLIEKNPLANMGDPKTLTNFLQFCNENYPADRKMVILWDHGGGSVSGILLDELHGRDSLSLAELSSAFEGATPASKENPPYDLIGFDACLMATIDVVDSLNGFARYMVASQELEPGIGWEYEGFFRTLANDSTIDGAELGKAICDTYVLGCNVYDGLAQEVTLSVVDMSYADRLLAAYYDVGAESLFYAVDDVNYFGEFGRAARSAVNFGRNNNTGGYSNMVDLGDLVRHSNHLLPQYGQTLLDLLDEAVIYMTNGKLRDRATGLSCYYSYSSDYREFQKYAELYGDLPFRWFYDYKITGELTDEGVRYVEDLMRSYSKPPVVEAKNIPEPVDLEDYPVTQRDDRYAVLDLGPQLARQVVEVTGAVAYVDRETREITVLGRGGEVEADWENGVFTAEYTANWGSIDGMSVCMVQTDSTAEYKLYAIPAIINGDLQLVNVGYMVATRQYEILGIGSAMEDDGMSNRDLRVLKPGDVVEPLFFGSGGGEDYSTSGRIVVTEDTRFEEKKFGDGIYIYMFHIVDIMGNEYLSEVTGYGVANGEVVAVAGV